MRRDRSPSEAAKPIRARSGHQNRKSVFPEFSEALGGPVVEVDVASIVRSGEAPVKEAPRSWSPNSPYFNAERHELNVVKAFSPPPHHCIFPGIHLVLLTFTRAPARYFFFPQPCRHSPRQVYDA